MKTLGINLATLRINLAAPFHFPKQQPMSGADDDAAANVIDLTLSDDEHDGDKNDHTANNTTQQAQAQAHKQQSQQCERYYCPCCNVIFRVYRVNKSSGL